MLYYAAVTIHVHVNLKITIILLAEMDSFRNNRIVIQDKQTVAKLEARQTKERNIILQRRKSKLGEGVPSESPPERNKDAGC